MLESCKLIKHKRIFFLSLLFFITISISFVSAQPSFPPFQEETTGGIDIQIPLLEFFEQGENITFNFHLFNTTTGLPITNITGTKCFFHLFNNKGKHVINNVEIPFEVLGDDYEIEIDGSNFTKLINQFYFVNCNSTTIGGASSALIIITADGNEPQTETNTRLNLFYIMLASSFLFLIIGLWREDPTLLNLSGIGFFITGLFIAMNDFVGLSNLMTQFLTVALWGLGFYIIFRTNIEQLDE
ncbi:hypothetical protein LCGC14_0374370 [marine sediment metagenome]|uniref:Uncharacterized protein n=1 Tax=marine sediment metagenome TaxID=412755 RepID=A0A0F9TM92_9ZZZZ